MAAPRILLDVLPVVFATALARVLADLGYIVDVGPGDGPHDLEVISGTSTSAAARRIVLDAVEGPAPRATLVGSGQSRTVEVRDLDTLIGLIESVLPLAAPPRGVTHHAPREARGA